jgi:hypothetical protein
MWTTSCSCRNPILPLMIVFAVVCCCLLRRPRLTATSMAWVANDFAFYGNKLFQSTFIALLYPTVN